MWPGHGAPAARRRSATARRSRAPGSRRPAPRRATSGTPRWGRRRTPRNTDRTARVQNGLMRGIAAAAGYVPRARLDLSTIRAVAGTGGGKGSRSVASYDEDTTTMAVEAGRVALRAASDVRPD